MKVNIAGEDLLLLPEKAVYWPREKMLIIADIHFGKAASFRAQGVPVPRGTTTQNLDALDTLMAQHDTRQLMFLGDFLHARAAHAPATLAVMLAWRQAHPGLRLVLVRGNHDLRAGDPSGALGLEVADEPFNVAPFAFCHHPGVDAAGYVLAGHVHPVYLLASGHDRLRLPCFIAGPTRMVLPSFGAFTGGFVVAPIPGERVWVSSGERVHCVR